MSNEIKLCWKYTSFDPSKLKGKFHIKIIILCKKSYGAAMKIHMCLQIFAQDLINHLKDKTKKIDKSNTESKSETNPGSQNVRAMEYGWTFSEYVSSMHKSKAIH